jgi:hypothetical protein
MKRRDLGLIVMVAVISAIFSYILSGVVFSSPAKSPVSVPVVTPISSSFADVKNDSRYKTIFSSALDPTQLIRIGGQTNNSPFTGR